MRPHTPQPRTACGRTAWLAGAHLDGHRWHTNPAGITLRKGSFQPGQFPSDRCLQIGGPEPDRARGAPEDNLTALADQVQAVREGPIGAGDAVVDGVDDDRHLDVEVEGAGDGHFAAFLIGSRVVHHYAQIAVRSYDPSFFGMGFADVHDTERHPVAVALPESVEGPQLDPERRSGVRAEDQGYGTITGHLLEAEYFTRRSLVTASEVVQRQFKVKSELSLLQLRC